jgi:hypothetical protein
MYNGYCNRLIAKRVETDLRRMMQKNELTYR